MDAAIYKKGRERHAFNPLTIIGTTNLALWLDVGGDPYKCLNASGLPCQQDEKCATLTSRNTNLAFSFVQATDAARPTYHGGRYPFLRFDGTDDYLRVADPTGTNAAGFLLMVAAYRNTNTFVPLSTCDEGVAANTSVWALLDAGAAPKLDIRVDNVQATDDRQQIVEEKCWQRGFPWVHGLHGNGTTWVSTIGGIEQTITSVTGSNTGQMFGGVANRDSVAIGCLYHAGGASAFSNMDLYELIYVNGDPTTEQIAQLQDYLKRKYRYYTVAHLGDSWAADAGYGIEVRNALGPDWYHVFNHGIGSETLAQIGARWDSDVEGKGFDCVIVEGAINDLKAASAGGHAALCTEFKRIVDEAVADGCAVVGCTCGPFGNEPGWSATRERETQLYNDFVRKYCEAKGVICADLYLFGRNPDPGIRHGDLNNALSGQNNALRPAWELDGGLHFNAAGDPFVARYVAEKVAQALNRNPA
jgi:lysophospholipase L1-like esterase